MIRPVPIRLALPLFIILLFSTNCAYSMVQMDSAYLKKNATQTFQAGARRCFTRVKSVLEDMGAKIVEERPSKGVVVTNRFVVNQIVYAAGGPNTAVATTMTETQKISVQVKGSKSDCQVGITEYLAWRNGERLNEAFVRPKVFEPFFAELKRQLGKRD